MGRADTAAVVEGYRAEVLPHNITRLPSSRTCPICLSFYLYTSLVTRSRSNFNRRSFRSNVQILSNSQILTRTDEEEIWWKMIISFLLSIEPFYNLFDRTTRKFLNDHRTLLDFDDDNLFSIVVSRYKSHCIYWIVHLFM